MPSLSQDDPEGRSTLPQPREALILAGGQGTRLRPIVGELPKPLAEICGRPFLERLFEQLIGFAFDRAILCVGHGADQIVKTFGHSFGTLRLDYSREPFQLGTGGALRHAVTMTTSPQLLVLNGDSYCAADLTDFCAAHLRFDGLATLVALHRNDRSRAGSIVIGPDNQILQFRNRLPNPTPGLINAGIYMFRRGALLVLPHDRKLSLEEEILPGFVARRQLYGWAVNCDFIDIGTPAAYLEAQDFFASR